MGLKDGFGIYKAVMKPFNIYRGASDRVPVQPALIMLS